MSWCQLVGNENKFLGDALSIICTRPCPHQWFIQHLNEDPDSTLAEFIDDICVVKSFASQDKDPERTHQQGKIGLIMTNKIQLECKDLYPLPQQHLRICV